MMWASFGRTPSDEQRAPTRLDVDAVGLELDRADVGAALAQAEQRAVVGRALDDDRVAGGDELVEQERVGLHRAVGDDHLRRRRPVLLGDPLAQRRVADRRSRSRSGPPGRCSKARLAAALQPLDVDDVQGRRPAGEGDGVGGHGAQGRRHGRAGSAQRPPHDRNVSLSRQRRVNS